MIDIQEIFKFYPCSTSKKLIVYFSSASAKYLDGVRQLEHYSINKLFVRDPNRTWYNGKIDGLCSDADSLKFAIASVMTQFKKEDVTFIGSSMGGYGAILFGCLLGVSQIFAIAPQIVINPHLPHSPKFVAKYSDLSEVLRRKPEETAVHIWFGCGELFDSYQVMRCSGIKNCSLYPVPQSLHNVLAYFKSKKLHEIFLESLILDKTFGFKYGNTDGIPYPQICTAIDAIFFEKNYKKSNDILFNFTHPLLDGARYSQIGSNFRNDKNYAEATRFLEKALAYNPENYEAYYTLGGIAITEKRYGDASKYYLLALEHFPGKNIDYLTQLAGAYRLHKDFDNALLYIEKAMSMNVDYPKAYYQAGLIYRDIERYSDAIVNFQRTIRLLPDFQSAYEQLKYSISRYYINDAKEKFQADLTINVFLDHDVCVTTGD